MKPTVGRIVHYVSYGTPGGEYASECRAAIVTDTRSGLLTEVTNAPAEHSSSEVIVGLAVLNPSGMFFNRAVQDEDGHKGGSWHWPERYGA